MWRVSAPTGNIESSFTEKLRMPGESRYAARHVDALWLPPPGTSLGLQPHGQRAAGNKPRRGIAFLETARSRARRRLRPAARFLALRPARRVGGHGGG